MITNINRYGKNDYLQFNKLNEFKNIVHGFTANKNTEVHTYEEVCKDLSLTEKNITFSEKQIHSNLVEIIYDDYNVTEVDGLITNKVNVPLFIRTADCISIILYDPVKKVIGNIHSGWKGTISRISEEAISIFKKEFSSNEKDILAFIFPAIGKCHFEVEEDVKMLFVNEFKEFDINNYIKDDGIRDGREKFLIDLYGIVKKNLIDLSLKEENIYITDYCTVCSNDRFYSHRTKEKGRNLTVVEMKGE